MPKVTSHQTDHPEDGEENNHKKIKAQKTSVRFWPLVI